MDWSAFLRANIEPMKPYAPGLRDGDVCERTGLTTLCKLSSNENPYPPFPAALVAMNEALLTLNRYPDGSSSDLTAALSSHFAVAEKNIVVGNGSNELLMLIGEACLELGDEVVYAWPSFIVYPTVAQACNAVSVPVSLTSALEHNLEAMLAAVTEKTKILFICNPNNPTGTVVTNAQFAEFMDRVPGHVLVVADEAYIEYVKDENSPDALNWFDGQRPLVILRTFSKIYSLAGARCGYGFMPEPLAQAIHKIREPFNVNAVAQAGALASLGSYEEVAARSVENAQQKERLYHCFDELHISYAQSETNFVWIEVERAQSVFEALLMQGVIVRDFGGGEALRVGVGSVQETDATIRAFQNLRKEEVL